MQYYFLIILLFYISKSQTFIDGDVRKSVQNLLRREYYNKIDIEPKLDTSVAKFLKEKINKVSDAKEAANKAKLLQKARQLTEHLNNEQETPMQLMESKIAREYYRIDPVLNQIKRRYLRRRMNTRRASNEDNDESSASDSSTLEMKDWKEEFQEFWMKKKFEAINSTYPRGDVVNMVAARPWGVPCGDPNQHDMPWGNCMLAAECDSEYRIYRGDVFCGRTQFVCCSLQLTTYDFYEGFDLSFADTSFSTDSAEKKARERGSKETKKRKKQREKNKRMKERNRRKRKMKKNIRRIVHEIRKILNRSFRNASHHRKKRTKLLKKYIRDLKKQYRKDRKSVRDIHSQDMDRVDGALEKRLQQVKHLNQNFLTNGTFRNIIVNGTMSKAGARMLSKAYPELKTFLRELPEVRRDGVGLKEIDTNELNDYLEYDIEYGALYY